MSAFIVSYETMHRVVAACRVHGADVTDPTTSGRTLFAMNRDAIRARYENRYPLSDFSAEGDGGAAYVYEEREAADPALFMALECFLYQCSEGNVPETALFAAVAGVRDAVVLRWTGEPNSEAVNRACFELARGEPWDF